MKINLTPFERIQLLASVPKNCALTEMAQLLRIADALELSEEEKEAYGYAIVKVDTPQGPMTFTTWDDDAPGLHGDEAEVELDGTEDAKKLIGIAKDRKTWPLRTESIVLMDKIDALDAEIKEQAKKKKEA